ncbi:MAG: helix-turn-helix domain-containing protein [Candidatus Woesearchaeota archaeon]
MFICPKCQSRILMNFDEDGAILNKCSNKECSFEFYSKEDIEYRKQQELRKQREYHIESMKKDDRELILVSNFKKIREQSMFAQRDIADVLDFSEQRLGAIERNTNTPTVVIAAKLARVLGVSLGDIYEEVLIPKDVFDRIKYLDMDFEFNEVLAENDRSYNKIKKEIRELEMKIILNNKAIKELKKEQSNTGDLKAETEKLHIENKKLKEDILELQKQSDIHYEIVKKEKNSLVLKQFSIIESDKWNELKEKFNIEV